MMEKTNMRKKSILVITTILLMTFAISNVVYAKDLTYPAKETVPTNIESEFFIYDNYLRYYQYDLVFGYPVYMNMKFDSNTETFQSSYDMTISGITEPDYVFTVKLDKERDNYGIIKGPNMDTYDLSESITETIAGGNMIQFTAEDCYENLLAENRLEGRGREDIKKAQLLVYIDANSFIPKYRGRYRTLIPLIVSLEEIEKTELSRGIYEDERYVDSWDNMLAKNENYKDFYTNETMSEFQAFYESTEGSDKILGGNPETTLYTYELYGLQRTTSSKEKIPGECEFWQEAYNPADYYLEYTYPLMTPVTFRMPEGYTKIAEKCFANMYTIHNIVFPSTLKKLSSYSCSNMTHLTQVSIRKGLTSIDANAFKDTELSDVYFEGTENEWKEIQIETEGNSTLLEANIHYEAVIK